MCLGNMGDLKIVLFGNRKIGINIPFGINNDCLTFSLTTYKLACLGKTFIVNVLKKHNFTFLVFIYTKLPFVLTFFSDLDYTRQITF